MQTLASISIRRPVFASMLILALVVVGGASWLGLGVDRFPSVDLPTVNVRTVLPGASPEEVEAQVTQQMEEAVNTVSGITELRSASMPGMSMVNVTFDLSRDIDVAAQDVRDRVGNVLSQLPDDVDPPRIFKVDNDAQPVLTVGVTANRSLRELTEIADKTVKRALERSNGVGEVELVGGLERAINIWIDADRIAAYRIPITDIRTALARQNADLPGGNVTASTREQTLRTMGRITDPRDFNELVIKTVNGAPIRVRDIGWAEDGTKEQRTMARVNGVPTVTLNIRRQSGTNTVAVIEAVKANMAAVQETLPPDVRLEVIRDQSRYIYNALHEINQHLVLGGIFACLVVFLFMRNWRATLIAGVAIPCSVISTFGMMRALDFTLNSVTMLALVLMVGIVIDDAIVVLENIFRFVEEKKLGAYEAARQATAEIALPVMATTLSLAVIFIPVSFMSSISGRFLYQFGITAAVAILVSLLVSFTLTPMMSARLLRPEDTAGHGGADGHGPASRGGFYGKVDSIYTRLLGFSMRHRLAVAGLALVVALSSIPLYGMVRQEYIPSDVDEAEFELQVNAPEGTSLAAMSDALAAIEREVMSTPGVRLTVASVGAGGFGGVSQGQFYIRIAPHEERIFSVPRLVKGLVSLDPLEAFRGNYSQRQVMQQLRTKLQNYKDLRIAVRNVQSFNLGGGNSEIDFVIRGPELTQLAAYTEHLRLKGPELGLVDADTSLRLDTPELRVEIDRARAADLHVDTQDIAAALRLMVGGDEEVTRYRDATVNDDYDVQLRLTEGDRNDLETIARLYVPREGGGLVRLDNVVRIVQGQSPSRVERLDRQRRANLRASVAPGFAQGDRIQAIRDEVERMNLMPGYSTAVSGRSRELERTGKEFAWAFLLSIAFMYMILAAQFESTIHPLTILLSLPVAVPFALFSLWVTGNTLNLYSAVGMLVLFGVVKKNAILQIDHMNNLRRQGMARLEAIMQANRDRLRPILMTTMTLVAGMLPLAFGTGPGAEERRTIAVVVIGGEMLSLMLTLLLTPVTYSLFDDAAHSPMWHRLTTASRAFAPLRWRRANGD